MPVVVNVGQGPTGGVMMYLADSSQLQELRLKGSTSGRDYIGPKTRQKPLWVAQAGRDGLDYAIFGKYAEGLHERADRFGIAHKTYQAVRDPVGRAMWIGLETYRAQLHAEYWRVRNDER